MVMFISKFSMLNALGYDAFTKQQNQYKKFKNQEYFHEEDY